MKIAQGTQKKAKRTTMFWSRNPQVSCFLDGENAVLFNPDTHQEKVINSTGLAVWEAMNGVSCTDDLAAELGRRFETSISDDILADTETFADDLLCQEFAIATDAPSAKPDVPETYSRREDVPRSFDLSLTGRCNLHCEYCFYNDEMVGRRDLPIEVWLNFFSELKRLAVRNLTLSGGEVFIRPDLWQLIDAIVDARMRYSILSNGTMITVPTLEKISRGGRRKRLNSIQVSIDGSCAAVHDASRGKGSFEKAVRGLRLLKDAGFPVVVRVTFNRHNVDDIENTADFLLETIGLSSFGCNEAIPMGTGCARRDEIGLTPAEQVRAMRILQKVTARYPGRINATAGPLAKLSYYRDMERERATGTSSSNRRMGKLSACGCAFLKLTVHHDGVIVPCNMLSIELGRIDRDNLTDIWNSHPVLEAMRSRGEVEMRKIPECRDCEWVDVCNGSCPSTAYTRTGSLISANLDDCYREFLKGITPEDRDELFVRQNGKKTSRNADQ